MFDSPASKNRAIAHMVSFWVPMGQVCEFPVITESQGIRSFFVVHRS